MSKQMRERHGIADAEKTAMYSEDLQSVVVTDGDGRIELSLGASSYPAGLTPDQAIFIAKQLVAAAKRVKNKARSQPRG
jgi:hypothetical protein